MSVYLYAKNSCKAANRLRAVIESKVSEVKIEVYRSIKAFSQKSHWPGFRIGRPIVILCAADKNDLQQMISFKPLLDDTRIILVLPDRQRDTVSMGHLMLPRFLTYSDANFKDVAAVLEKMLRNSVSVIDSNANLPESN